MKIRRLLCVCALMLAGSLAAGCGDKSDVPARTIVVSLAQAPSASIDPIRVVDVHSAAVMAAAHAPLAYVGLDGGIVPVLAESLAIDESAKSLSITLRAARFWDGSEVSAEHVRQSIQRLVKSGHPHASWIFKHVVGFSDFREGKTANLAGIEIDSNRVLRIALAQPDPDFAVLFSSSLTSVVKVVEGAPSRPYDTHVIGAGAYQPDGGLAPDRLHFNSNPGFPGRQTSVQRIEFKVHSNPANALLALEAERVDLVRLRGPQLSEALEANGAELRARLPKATVRMVAGNELTFLLLNWSKQPLASVPEAERRRYFNALSGRIDRERLASELYPLGTTKPIWSLGELGGLEPSRIEDAVAPTESRSGVLLADNGPASRALAAHLQAQLKEVGLSLDPEFMELGQLVQRWLQTDYGVSLAWIEHQIPANFGLEWLVLHDPSSPFAVLGSKREWLVDGIADARKTMDATERQRAYEELYRKLDREQTAWLPLLRRHTVYAHSSSLSGFVLDRNGALYLPRLTWTK